MSNMSPDDHELRDVAGLAGLYALDALDQDDRERFETYLVTNPDARDEVAGYRATAARLADLSATDPPAAMRDRVLAGVAATRQDAPVVRLDDQRAARARRRRATLAVAAAVAVVLAAFGGYSLADRSTGPESELASLLARPDTRVVPLTAVGSGAVGGNVIVAPGADRVVLVSDDMPPPAAGRTYELWNVNADGVHNAGLFVPDADGSLHASLDVPLGSTTRLVVTDEPAGGSPVATTDPLMEATLE